MQNKRQWLLLGSSLLLAYVTVGSVFASDSDVTALEDKVQARVAQIEQTGLLPTSVEIEQITGDIVDQEVQTEALKVDDAVAKYQLTPTLERYIKIKKASREQVSPSDIKFPPPPPHG